MDLFKKLDNILLSSKLDNSDINIFDLLNTYKYDKEKGNEAIKNFISNNILFSSDHMYIDLLSNVFISIFNSDFNEFLKIIDDSKMKFTSTQGKEIFFIFYPSDRYIKVFCNIRIYLNNQSFKIEDVDIVLKDGFNEYIYDLTRGKKSLESLNEVVNHIRNYGLKNKIGNKLDAYNKIHKILYFSTKNLDLEHFKENIPLLKIIPNLFSKLNENFHIISTNYLESDTGNFFQILKFTLRSVHEGIRKDRSTFRIIRITESPPHQYKLQNIYEIDSNNVKIHEEYTIDQKISKKEFINFVSEKIRNIIEK